MAIRRNPLTNMLIDDGQPDDPSINQYDNGDIWNAADHSKDLNSFNPLTGKYEDDALHNADYYNHQSINSYTQQLQDNGVNVPQPDILSQAGSAVLGGGLKVLQTLGSAFLAPYSSIVKGIDTVVKDTDSPDIQGASPVKDWFDKNVFPKGNFDEMISTNAIDLVSQTLAKSVKEFQDKGLLGTLGDVVGGVGDVATNLGKGFVGPIAQAAEPIAEAFNGGVTPEGLKNVAEWTTGLNDVANTAKNSKSDVYKQDVYDSLTKVANPVYDIAKLLGNSEEDSRNAGGTGTDLLMNIVTAPELAFGDLGKAAKVIQGGDKVLEASKFATDASKLTKAEEAVRAAGIITDESRIQKASKYVAKLAAEKSGGVTDFSGAKFGSHVFATPEQLAKIGDGNKVAKYAALAGITALDPAAGLQTGIRGLDSLMSKNEGTKQIVDGFKSLFTGGKNQLLNKAMVDDPDNIMAHINTIYAKRAIIAGKNTAAENVAKWTKDITNKMKGKESEPIINAVEKPITTITTKTPTTKTIENPEYITAARDLNREQIQSYRSQLDYYNKQIAESKVGSDLSLDDINKMKELSAKYEEQLNTIEGIQKAKGLEYKDHLKSSGLLSDENKPIFDLLPEEIKTNPSEVLSKNLDEVKQIIIDKTGADSDKATDMALRLKQSADNIYDNINESLPGLNGKYAGTEIVDKNNLGTKAQLETDPEILKDQALSLATRTNERLKDVNKMEVPELQQYVQSLRRKMDDKNPGWINEAASKDLVDQEPTIGKKLPKSSEDVSMEDWFDKSGFKFNKIALPKANEDTIASIVKGYKVLDYTMGKTSENIIRNMTQDEAETTLNRLRNTWKIRNGKTTHAEIFKSANKKMNPLDEQKSLSLELKGLFGVQDDPIKATRKQTILDRLNTIKDENASKRFVGTGTEKDISVLGKDRTKWMDEDSAKSSKEYVNPPDFAFQINENKLGEKLSTDYKMFNNVKGMYKNLEKNHPEEYKILTKNFTSDINNLTIRDYDTVKTFTDKVIKGEDTSNMFKNKTDLFVVKKEVPKVKELPSDKPMYSNPLSKFTRNQPLAEAAIGKIDDTPIKKLIDINKQSIEPSIKDTPNTAEIHTFKTPMGTIGVDAKADINVVNKAINDLPEDVKVKVSDGIMSFMHGDIGAEGLHDIVTKNNYISDESKNVINTYIHELAHTYGENSTGNMNRTVNSVQRNLSSLAGTPEGIAKLEKLQEVINASGNVNKVTMDNLKKGFISDYPASMTTKQIGDRHQEHFAEIAGLLLHPDITVRNSVAGAIGKDSVELFNKTLAKTKYEDIPDLLPKNIKAKDELVTKLYKNKVVLENLNPDLWEKADEIKGKIETAEKLFEDKDALIANFEKSGDTTKITKTKQVADIIKKEFKLDNVANLTDEQKFIVDMIKSKLDEVLDNEAKFKEFAERENYFPHSYNMELRKNPKAIELAKIHNVDLSSPEISNAIQRKYEGTIEEINKKMSANKNVAAFMKENGVSNFFETDIPKVMAERLKKSNDFTFNNKMMKMYVDSYAHKILTKADYEKMSLEDWQGLSKKLGFEEKQPEFPSQETKDLGTPYNTIYIKAPDRDNFRTNEDYNAAVLAQQKKLDAQEMKNYQAGYRDWVSEQVNKPTNHTLTIDRKFKQSPVMMSDTHLPEEGDEANLVRAGLESVGIRDPFVDVDREFVHSGKVYEATNENHYIMPKYAVADYRNTIQKEYGSYKNGILKMYDKLQNIFKSMAVMSPSFHINNALGNIYNSYTEIGSKILSPKLNKVMFQLLETKKDGNFAGYTYQELRDEINKADIGLGSGQLVQDANDARKLARHEDIKEPNALQKIAGFVPKNLNKLNREIVGGRVEGYSKVVNFLSHIESGKSIEEAVDLANKVMFDYSDLTDVEQNVMKRIIPFYTFIRKNVPLQIEQMANKPKAYAPFIKFLEDSQNNLTPEEKRLQPSSLGSSIPIGGGKYLSLNLPFMDMDKATNPTSLFGMLTPLAKMGVENLTNKNVYFDSPITNPGDTTAAPAYMGIPGVKQLLDTIGATKETPNGQFMDKRARYILQNILPIGEAYNKVGTAIGSSDDAAKQKAAGWLTGIKTTTPNLDTQKQQAMYDYITKLKNTLANAKREGRIKTK